MLELLGRVLARRSYSASPLDRTPEITAMPTHARGTHARRHAVTFHDVVLELDRTDAPPGGPRLVAALAVEANLDHVPHRKAPRRRVHHVEYNMTAGRIRQGLIFTTSAAPDRAAAA